MIRQGGATPLTSRHVVIDIPASPSSSKRRGIPATSRSRLDGEKLFFLLLVGVVIVWICGYMLFLSSVDKTGAGVYFSY